MAGPFSRGPLAGRARRASRFGRAAPAVAVPLLRTEEAEVRRGCWSRTACKFYGVKYALAVNSGTGALFTAMTALGIGPGCEVIVPAFFWVATVGAVVHANAIPVLCEVDDSFCMDPQDLARKITPRTKLIVPVHMAGVPCDMKAIMAVADKHGIPVLEDCAQANGGSFHGQSSARSAPGHVQPAMEQERHGRRRRADRHQRRKLYERCDAAHDLGIPWVGSAAEPGGTVTWGGGRRMSELTAAVAVQQLKKLPAIVAAHAGLQARIKAAAGRHARRWASGG